MKKLFTIILMAVVLFTACTKENTPAVDQIVTINATIASDTKVALGQDDEKKVNWTAGDIINLTIKEVAYSFTWQEGTTFAYTGDAILPALTQDLQITASYAPEFSTTQTGLKADVGNYMALTAEETVDTEKNYGDLNLTFSHGTSVLKLTLSNEAFKSADVTDITVKAGGTVIAKATEPLQGDAETGNVTAYFAINPATLNNVTLHATCGENKYFGTLTNNELTSGKLYNATAALANVCFLPNGSTFKTAINTFLGNNTTLTTIKFIADPSWAPTGTETQIETCGAYMVANTSTKTLEIRTATSCFVFNENCQSMFSGSNSKISTITSIDFGNSINTMQVNNMRSMFYKCTSLVELKLGSSFNTGSVTNMYYVFHSCNKLKAIDLSSFNTSNATNMRGMFAKCYELNSLTFGSNFNTANVTDMGYMFQEINKNNNSKALDLNLTGFTFKSEVIIEEIFQDAGPTNVKVTETGYNFLKNKKTSNIIFVKEDGITPWE